MMLISVIVTTYNREDALEAVLRSLARQTDQNFEVVVADDGSKQPTAALVESWKARIGHRLEHVWHEDRGFRAAEIRNRAILASRGDYVVFLDGDCIARPDFVATHRRLAERGWFVTGNRILLSSELTAKVLREKLAPESWRFADWVAQRWRGWGKEDSDIIVRLQRAGVRRKDGVFATGVLHLWHAEADRGALADNERKLSDVITGGNIRAQCGLSALREAGPAVTIARRR